MTDGYSAYIYESGFAEAPAALIKNQIQSSGSLTVVLLESQSPPQTATRVSNKSKHFL